LRYIERYIEQKKPSWELELNTLAFRRLGLSHWPFEHKMALAVGSLSFLSTICIISVVCLCCKITFNRAEIKRLEKKHEKKIKEMRD
jgi:hypothetical protein